MDADQVLAVLDLRADMVRPADRQRRGLPGAANGTLLVYNASGTVDVIADEFGWFGWFG
jgi:hypothetical protein